MEVNLNFKVAVLLAICLQNAGYSLLRKYSVSTEDVSSKEILFVAEVIKVLVSLYLVSLESYKDEGGVFNSKVYSLIHSSGKMFILASIYACMNLLSFVALEYIGAGEFTIFAQLKVLTTAVFSKLVLGTKFSYCKWRALFLLVLGCLLVASPAFTGGSSNNDTINILTFFGYMAVLTEVILSGFASIYFEKVIKSTSDNHTIWERNFQLGMYSGLFYLCCMTYDSIAVKNHISWSNWSILTMAVALFGAGGGLLVAAALKYADSIMKCLATSGAIVIATGLGRIFLNGPLDIFMGIGAGVVIIAISNYSLDKTVE